jgi:hypothetical protein
MKLSTTMGLHIQGGIGMILIRWKVIEEILV